MPTLRFPGGGLRFDCDLFNHGERLSFYLVGLLMRFSPLLLLLKGPMSVNISISELLEFKDVVLFERRSLICILAFLGL